VSRGVQSICERIGTKKIQTSGYNPTGNACVERFHRFFILHNRTGLEWDNFIAPVLFAYRASQHDTTGFSPFYLETGRFPSLPTGVLIQQFEKDEIKTETEWADTILKRLRTAFEYVREAQEETARKNKERKHVNTFAPDFKEGDCLFVWERSAEETRLNDDIKQVTGFAGRLPTKLVNKWTGPFPFVRMDGDS